MGGNNREFMLAIALSAVVLIAWQVFFGIPKMEEERQRLEATEQTATQDGGENSALPDLGDEPSVSGDTSDVPIIGETAVDREATISASARIMIDTPALEGSINLTGARIDDLRLRRYHETVDEESPIITLLSPVGTSNAYFAYFAWQVPANSGIDVPKIDTVWSADEYQVLTEEDPVTLTYDNGAGLIFTRTISLDENYLFTVEDEVYNTSGNTVQLHPFGQVARYGTPEILDFFVLHEGFVGWLETAFEVDYDDLEDDDSNTKKFNSVGGWLGISDKYWAVALLPQQDADLRSRIIRNNNGSGDIYRMDYVHEQGVEIADGTIGHSEAHLFAGAKIVSIIDEYEETFEIENFHNLIDWGWFFFITIPLFSVLDFFYNILGNFGFAILAVTVCVKIVFFPLANKSYVSMGRMKKLQPEVMKLRERYADDKPKLQQETMALYKKEKVNPAAGCLPILIQIPVFFALYKVLFGTIEMRHAPFIGWIQDLSAPDPTTLFNLFGLIPWDPPSFLAIGVWPLIMGITMFVQMRLNPPPPDPTQAMIFNWMPVFFTFLLATFPAGLIIYWAWNNSLSIAQQWVIMSRQGVKVELFSNIKQTFTRKKKTQEGDS